MRLIGNKEHISYVKIYSKEDNIRYSNINIWHEQDIYTISLITSNYLIGNIYNEINRE
jgi:hypothetical protein